MKDTFVLLGLFTLMLGFAYAVLSSILPPAIAFLVGAVVVATVAIALFGLREGLNYDNNLVNMNITGNMITSPTQWDGSNWTYPNYYNYYYGINDSQYRGTRWTWQPDFKISGRNYGFLY